MPTMTEKEENPRESLKELGLKMIEIAENQTEKDTISKSMPTKRRYKEIKLYLTEDRQDQLKRVCELMHEDYSRVEDGQSSLIWEIVEWVEASLKVRQYISELYAPIINATPEKYPLKTK